MNYRKLGRTGLQVSELGFGAWGIGGSGYGPTDDNTSLKALDFAFDQGINFFDTADVYGHGHSEKLIGQTFKASSKRTKAIIASKVGWDFYASGNEKRFDAEHIRFACGESLRRLQTDYIDVYQLHNPKMELIQDGSVFKVLGALQAEGKIRFWGVSIHLAREGIAVIQQGSSDVIQAIYHLVDQRIRGELMPVCEEHDIGLIVREPLYCGLLTGKYSPSSTFHKEDHRNRWPKEKLEKDFQKIDRLRSVIDEKRVPLKGAALEFVLSESATSVVIPGMKTVQQVEDHLAAVRKPKLTPAELERLREMFHEDELFQTGFLRS